MVRSSSPNWLGFRGGTVWVSDIRPGTTKAGRSFSIGESENCHVSAIALAWTGE